MGSAERLRLAVSQRVLPASGSTPRCDALDQEWAVRLEAEGCMIFPVPNRLGAVATWMDALAPDALLLTGGNTPVNSHVPADADAAPERDALEGRGLGRVGVVVAVARGGLRHRRALPAPIARRRGFTRRASTPGRSAPLAGWRGGSTCRGPGGCSTWAAEPGRSRSRCAAPIPSFG